MPNLMEIPSWKHLPENYVIRKHRKRNRNLKEKTPEFQFLIYWN